MFLLFVRAGNKDTTLTHVFSRPNITSFRGFHLKGGPQKMHAWKTTIQTKTRDALKNISSPPIPTYRNASTSALFIPKILLATTFASTEFLFLAPHFVSHFYDSFHSSLPGAKKHMKYKQHFMNRVSWLFKKKRFLTNAFLLPCIVIS